MLVLVTVDLCCAVLVFLLRVSACGRSVFRKHLEIAFGCMCILQTFVLGYDATYDGSWLPPFRHKFLPHFQGSGGPRRLDSQKQAIIPNLSALNSIPTVL
jgi:hypothetical protein